MTKAVLLHIFGWIFFLNYRIIYALVVTKQLKTYEEWARSMNTDKDIALILTIHLVLWSWVIFGLFWAIVIFGIVSALNGLVWLVFYFKKRLEKKG